MWTFIAICTVFFDEKTKHTGKSAIKDPPHAKYKTIHCENNRPNL